MIIYSRFRFSLVLSEKKYAIYTKHNIIIILAEENFQSFEKLLNYKYTFLIFELLRDC